MITDTDDWGWGALVAFRRLGTTPGKSEGPLIGKNESCRLGGVDQNYVLDILLGTSADESGIKAFDKDDDKGDLLLASSSSFPSFSFIKQLIIFFSFPVNW